MQALGIVLSAALPAGAAAILILGAISLCYYRQTKGTVKKEPSQQIDRSEGSVTKRFWPLGGGGCGGISRDPCESYYKQSNRIANEWRAAYPIKPFDWGEHPGRVAEAVEHGWAAFAFTYSTQLIGSPMQHKLWGFCTAGCSQSPLLEPEMSWEVGAGSSDYVQKIRLNPGFIPAAAPKRQGETKPVQALQTTLPLPGPPLGPLFFPEEGYFEITILANGADSNVDSSSQVSFNENEHAKLINSASSTDHAGHSVVTAGVHPSSEFKPRSSYYNGNESAQDERRPSFYNVPNLENDLPLQGRAIEDINRLSGDVHDIAKVSTCSKQTSTGDASSLADINASLISANSSISDIHDLLRRSQICAIGLAAGSAPPFRLPGCDPGSIGFFSDGRVFINGVEHVHKAAITKNWRRKSWGGTNTTVGCGFDPTAGRLRFTLNGEVAEELALPDDAGGEGGAFARQPLFPTVAANYDVAMTANFGQAPFEWGPANGRRVADPCLGRAPPRPPELDSGDLFSMPWLSDVGPSPSPSPSPAPTRVRQAPRQPEPATSPSQRFDSDFFEIVLDSSRSTPSVPHHGTP